MNTSKQIKTVGLIFTLVILMGYISTAVIVKRIDSTQRKDLMQQAKQAALLVSSSDITMLSGSSLDLESDIYNRLKSSISLFRSYNPATRFVYVLGYRPEIKKQFFYVDSEPTLSSEYSPPGQIFVDTRDEDIAKYKEGEAYTDGPYTDSWGEWVSGYAPIKNGNGDMVALLGIDTATSVWRQQTGFVRSTIALITLLLASLLSVLVLFIQRKQSFINILKRENQTLSYKEGKLSVLQHMAQIGTITIYFPSATYSFDTTFSEIIGVKEKDLIDQETFFTFIHPADVEKFKATLQEILRSDILYTWVDTRMGSHDRGFRTYHIYGNIERDEFLAPKRFSGIIQDITDIHTI